MKLKKTAAAVLFGLGFASFAQAATNLGELSFSNSVIQWADRADKAGAFEDVYSFTVASDLVGVNATTYASVFDISWIFGNSAQLSDLLVSIYKGADTSAPLVFQQSGVLDPLGHWGVSGSFTLDSSAYTLVVAGTAPNGNSGYTFTLNAPAVPEPETYAMLLAGLGIVGSVARRRTRTR